MSTALDRRPNRRLQPDPLEADAMEAFQRADATPATIDLGTCVRLCPFGGRAARSMTEEGVVIEVVPPWQPVRSARVIFPPSRMSSRSKVPRYVVQCWERRVVRRAAELLVVAL
jgi:hypothetical protein